VSHIPQNSSFNALETPPAHVLDRSFMPHARTFVDESFDRSKASLSSSWHPRVHTSTIRLLSPLYPSNRTLNKSYSISSYAFVEFRSTRDADAAYRDMWVFLSFVFHLQADDPEQGTNAR
jgi:hypothetical protein